MPRPRLRPRLYLRKGKGGSRYWIIRDGAKDTRTGCSEHETEQADKALQAYLADKHDAPRRQRRLDDIPILDVLMIYAEDKLPELATFHKAKGRIRRLGEWWAGKTLADVTGRNCRAFARERGDGAARRELQDLQAAIGHHHKEGFHREDVRVSLPAAGAPRERWLTRDEVAKLLWICWRTRHETNDTRPLRHLARFVLFAVYTGSRPGDCLGASFRLGSGSYVDTERGLFYRRPQGKRETKKRQPTIPIPSRLLAHLRRWERAGHGSVVEFGGGPCGSIKTAWHRLITLAGPGFEDVVPYTCRHTAATWMCQRGVPLWQVAGFLGTSEAMIEKHYGHHHPEHLKEAVKAAGGRR